MTATVYPRGGGPVREVSLPQRVCPDTAFAEAVDDLLPAKWCGIPISDLDHLSGASGDKLPDCKKSLNSSGGTVPLSPDGEATRSHGIARNAGGPVLLVVWGPGRPSKT